MKIRFLSSAYKPDGWRMVEGESLDHRIRCDVTVESDMDTYDSIALSLLNWQLDNGDNLWHLVERLNSLAFPMRLQYANWNAVVSGLPIPPSIKESLFAIKKEGMVPMLSVWCEGYEANYYERMMLLDAEEQRA